MSPTSLSAFALLCIALIAAPAAALAPVASFSADTTSGPAPLEVSFADTSSGSPAGWAWYFGDENYTSSRWVQTNPSAPHAIRAGTTSVALPDGSIVTMGGQFQWNQNTYEQVSNEIWRSTDNGATWVQQTFNASWMQRPYPHCVVLPDGSIVLMGGDYGPSGMGGLSDVWRSTDKGVCWTLQTPAAEWGGEWGRSRQYFSSIVLSDGSILVMGGQEPYGGAKNDVWRSNDKGATWSLVTAAAAWAPRSSHTSVALPDGSIVVMGGQVERDNTVSSSNDVWRSTDQGVTWTWVNPTGGFSPRFGHTSVVLPDGSILLMGGVGGLNQNWMPLSDVWRSTDRGTTWAQLTINAGWSPRAEHSCSVLPDGSIVLLGEHGEGTDPNLFHSDVWRLDTASSHARNPYHAYAKSGTYSVALQASNADGYSSTIRKGYITVTNPPTITSIMPNNGTAGSTVAVAITGTGFVPDSTIVSLSQAGSAPIPATHIIVESETRLTCRFTLPSTAATSSWDVTVTNPEGQSGTLPDGFDICAVFRFAPSSLRVPVGANNTTTLYLDGLAAGLTGFDVTLNLSLPDPTIGEIVGVTMPGWDLIDNTTLPADSVRVRAVDLTNVVGPGGDILVGTVTVRGDRAGQTELRVVPVRIDDEGGETVETRLAACSVNVLPAPYLPCISAYPTDQNGDGLYEDVNGNGRKDFNDVVTLFTYLDAIAADDDWPFLNFNGNNRMDFADIVWLFNHL